MVGFLHKAVAAGRAVLDKGRELVVAGFVGVTLTVADAAPSFAQATSMYPVSADVATVKADLLLWATAFLGVVLAIYGYFKIKRIAR